MALESTQPLTEMSTRNISWGKGGRCVGLTTYHLHVQTVSKSASLNFLEPLGPAQGLLYLYIENNTDVLSCSWKFPILLSECSEIWSLLAHFLKSLYYEISWTWRSCEKQTNRRMDERTKGQMDRHTDRKINTAKPIRAFWTYENVPRTSDFCCILQHLGFRMIMCVHNISSLIFTVEKQGDVCELGILFLKTIFEWMSHFELLIVCQTFEYFS